MGLLALLSLASLCVAGPPVASAVLLWRADPGERDFVNHIVVLLALGAAVPPLLIRVAEAFFGMPDSVFPVLLQAYAPMPPSIFTGLIEEAAKGAVVLGAFLWMRRGFADAFDGLAIGAVVGAGYALAQGLVYLEALAPVAHIARLSTGGLLAIGGAGLVQCAFTAVFGACLGSVRAAAGRPWFVPVIGFVTAAVYHMAYVGLGTLGAAASSTGLVAAAGIARAAVDWSGIVLVIVASCWGWSAGARRRGPAERGADRRGFLPYFGAAVAVTALFASAAVILTALHVASRPGPAGAVRAAPITVVLARLGPNQRPVQETNVFEPGDVVGATATPSGVPEEVTLQAAWLRTEADHVFPIRDPERFTLGPAAYGRAQTFSLAGAPPGLYVFVLARVGPGRALRVVAAERFFVE
jgi:RsiW-degrading membrane proteinase PrsW (M82 family)